MAKCVPLVQWRVLRARVARLIRLLILVTMAVGMCSESQSLLKLMNALRDLAEHFPGRTFLHDPKEMKESERPHACR